MPIIAVSAIFRHNKPQVKWYDGSSTQWANRIPHPTSILSPRGFSNFHVPAPLNQKGTHDAGFDLQPSGLVNWIQAFDGLF